MKYLIALLLMSYLPLCKAADKPDAPKKKSGWFDLHDKFYEKRVYFYWGYNRDYYAHSDIHFHGPGYNFTLYDVPAHDKPTPFSLRIYAGPGTLTIPQYNYRLGFYIKYNIHISFGMDHMKYVIFQNETVNMTGTIAASLSPKYAGTYANTPTLLSPDFVRLQHTNGLNLLTCDVRWQLPIYHTRSDIIHIGWNFCVGAGPVVTRTEFHLMDVFYYNPFHLSGLTLPVATGPRIELWKCFFVAAELKGGEVWLPWAPAENTSTSGIHQNITFMEYYVVVGLSFPLSKKDYPFLKRKKNKAAQPLNQGT